MKLRFLQTTPSLSPEYPFQAGQIIEVASLTPEMALWLKGETPSAELLREEGDELEVATVGVREKAVTRHGRKGR